MATQGWQGLNCATFFLQKLPVSFTLGANPQACGHMWKALCKRLGTRHHGDRGMWVLPLSALPETPAGQRGVISTGH